MLEDCLFLIPGLHFFFNVYFLKSIHLALLGISYGLQDLWSSLWHMGSVA